MPLLNSSSPESICVLNHRLQMYIGELTSLALIPSTLHWKEGWFMVGEGRRCPFFLSFFCFCGLQIGGDSQNKSFQPGQLVDRPGESSFHH
jgi:hypothetical protein